MKLFEERVKGALYFKVKLLPKGKVDMTDLVAKRNEVLKTILKTENLFRYMDLRYFNLVWKDDKKKCRWIVMDRQIDEHTYECGGELLCHFEVDCWESAWNRLEKLTWVTGTGKVL